MNAKERYIVYRGQKFNVDEETYRGYYRIIMNERNMLKRQEEEKLLSLDHLLSEDTVQQIAISSSLTVEEAFEHKEMMKLFYQAINTLDLKEKQIISELFYKGNSETKLAKELGVSQQALNTRKHRILKKIKLFLQNVL